MRERKPCVCVREPRGECGLEGYIEGIQYEYRLLPNGKVRVWDFIHSDVVGPKVFKRYFETRGE